MIATPFRLVTAEGYSEAPRTSREQQRRWTLREAYENVLKRDQERQRCKKSTIAEYRGMLKHWERWLSRSNNPGQIAQITDEQLEDFADWLAASGKRGRTVNKNAIYVEAILKRCGPKGPHNKRGRQIIDEWVSAERRPENDSKPRKRVVPLEVIERIYRECRVAKRPRHTRTPPPLTWRTALLMGLTYGPRRNDWLLMPRECVTFEPECPLGELKISHQWGWLTFVPEKTEGFKTDPIALPLTKGLHFHLKQIEGRKVPNGKDQLLPFATCQRDWYREFYAIQAAAGIRQPYTFQELRKTANVEWDALPGSNSDVGRYVLGHAARDVNAQHYKATARTVCALIDSFPMADQMPD